MKPKQAVVVAIGALTLCTSLHSQELPVSGVVTDEKGTPIVDVLVAADHKLDNGGYSAERTQTGSDGSYRLPSVGRVLFFRKAGFAPRTIVRSSSEVNAALRAHETDWHLSRCTLEQQKAKYLGDSLLLFVPKDFIAENRGSDVDYQKIWLQFPRKQKEKMLIWTGGTLGGGISYFPDESWFLDGSTIAERLEPDYLAIDVRGVTPEGKRWRSISILNEIVEYQGVSAEAAAYFDRIIDSACLHNWNENARTQP